MNIDITEIERVVDALLKGETPKTKLDPKVMKMIKKLITKVQSVDPDPEFKARLLERIHEKLAKPVKVSVWKSPWFRFGFPGVAWAVVLWMFVSLGFLGRVGGNFFARARRRIFPIHR